MTMTICMAHWGARTEAAYHLLLTICCLSWLRVKRFGKGLNHGPVILLSLVIVTGCNTTADEGLTAPEKAAIGYFDAFLAADAEQLKTYSTTLHYQQKFAQMAPDNLVKPNMLSLLGLIKDGTYTKKLNYVDDNTATLEVQLFKKTKMGWQLTLVKTKDNWQVDKVSPLIDPRYQALYVTIDNLAVTTDKSFLQPVDTVILVTNNIEETVACKLFKLLDGDGHKEIRLGFRAVAMGTNELIIPKGLASHDYQLICQSEGGYHELANFKVR